MFGFNMNFIDWSRASELLDQGAQLIDVRTEDEFRRGAIPGARNLPLHEIHRANEHLDKQKPVIVYCVSGARSGQAQSVLGSMGFDSVFNLGSVNAYAAA